VKYADEQAASRISSRRHERRLAHPGRLSRRDQAEDSRELALTRAEQGGETERSEVRIGKPSGEGSAAGKTTTRVVTAPLQCETRTIPIVFAAVADPVEEGFVADPGAAPSKAGDDVVCWGIGSAQREVLLLWEHRNDTVHGSGCEFGAWSR
jgi:hypothetical protein